VEIETITVNSDLITDRVLSTGEEFLPDQRGDLFDITAEIDAPPHAAFGIRLHEIDIACADGHIRCLGNESPLTAHDQKVSLRILVDRTSIEIYAQGAVHELVLPAHRTGHDHTMLFRIGNYNSEQVCGTSTALRLVAIVAWH